MQSRAWLNVAVLAVVVAAFLFVLDLVFGLPHLIGYQDTSLVEILSRRSFESTAWKQAGRSDESIRITMVDDLLQTHRLAGMSQSEIDALLGAPDKTTYFSQYNYVYWLGPERGFFSIDSEWLCIRFEKGTVVEAKILRD